MSATPPKVSASLSSIFRIIGAIQIKKITGESGEPCGDPRKSPLPFCLAVRQNPTPETFQLTKELDIVLIAASAISNRYGSSPKLGKVDLGPSFFFFPP